MNFRTFIGVALFSAVSLAVGAQVSRNDTGIHDGSPIVGEMENVNLKTGNLNIQIPIIEYPGRGGTKFTVGLTYNSNF
jgi:hypothetical protein